MPIGVPRIIYCWGEELPAQWTDIYNFIFRRRMVFLMQYLDDELCNQICGLLINIHMEDRSKELEKKEMENSGLFKNQSGSRASTRVDNRQTMASSSTNLGTKKQRSIEDLMISEEDLGIDDNHMLERQTLQKISLEWLNWNAQFFDYSDEPYLFYLAELLAKDFEGGNANLNYSFYLNGTVSNEVRDSSQTQGIDVRRFMNLFKQMSNAKPDFFQDPRSQGFEVYSPFRLLKDLAKDRFDDPKTVDAFFLKQGSKDELRQKLSRLKPKSDSANNELISEAAQKNLLARLRSRDHETSSGRRALTQRELRRHYSEDYALAADSKVAQRTRGARNYLNANDDASYFEYRDYYRKQTERTIQDEESKKVFMIINSFGGSVGNGITVHDALQFIKAGSMTLALGVAASAASLALAGGTIGERYVTEGCHVMIHQPESGLSGQASDIWIDSQEIMKIRLDVAEIYSLSTYRPRHKILRDLDRDFYLSATETIHYGLADEIATNETLHEIIEMTNKVWDYHDAQQQKLLETRESLNAGLDTQTQN